jgi:hypothetical protein
LFLRRPVKEKYQRLLGTRGRSLGREFFALPDIVHILSPDDEAKVHDAKLDGLKVVVSALYTETDPAARYLSEGSRWFLLP